MESPRECTWCDSGAPPIPMHSGHEMPFVCSGCGTDLGYADTEGLAVIINTLRNDRDRLFNEIFCMEAEGVEFMPASDRLEAINKVAHEIYDRVKHVK